jgi:hypothetical protein
MLGTDWTYTLGWVDFDEKIIFNKSAPGIYSFLCKSSENRRKKFEVTIGSRKWHDLSGRYRYLIRAENFFSEPSLDIYKKQIFKFFLNLKTLLVGAFCH